jgi:hypothetical protein
MKKLTIILALTLFGCAKQPTLGLKHHTFGNVPRNIIWFQVPGLTLEHLAMLRFSYSEVSTISAFETASCTGAMWNFNIYDLRPTANISFLSQMSSSRAITQECASLPDSNIWTYLDNEGYQLGLYEYGAEGNQSYQELFNCGDQISEWKERATFWFSSRAATDVNHFHFQEESGFTARQVYYDQTCQARSCFAEFSTNVMSIWRRFKGDRGKTAIIIRDFSYLNALKSRNIQEARERLLEIEKAISMFTRDPYLVRESLILLTSSEGVQFEFPAQGQDWKEFEGRGRHVLFREKTLHSPAFAWGARAENFCGYYSESEILGRILFTPRQADFRQSIKSLL